MYARFLLALASVPWLVAAQDDTNEEFTTTVLGEFSTSRSRASARRFALRK